jgi:hypothetical protein
VTQAPRLAPAVDGPGADLLLDVDREYRHGAAAGQLPTIAPRRFNAEGKAWLPVLHGRRVVRGREGECRDWYAAH